MFKLNIEKAKDIHRDNIRQARHQVLQKLDVQYMKALESGDSQKINEVASIKQQLRDLTTCEEIECATCLDDLKNHWPSILECDSPYQG